MDQSPTKSELEHLQQAYAKQAIKRQLISHRTVNLSNSNGGFNNCVPVPQPQPSNINSAMNMKEDAGDVSMAFE